MLKRSSYSLYFSLGVDQRWCRSTLVSIDTMEDVDRHPRRPKADMIYQVFKNFKKSLEVFVTPNVF